MRRLNNNYCWYTIEDWLNAQTQGYVEMREPHQNCMEENSDHNLKKLLKMAEDDCIPILIVCLKDNNGYYIENDCFIYQLFDFLRNKIPLSEDKVQKFFSDLEPDKRISILNAQVFSLWIDVT